MIPTFFNRIKVRLNKKLRMFLLPYMVHTVNSMAAKLHIECLPLKQILLLHATTEKKLLKMRFQSEFREA